MAGHELFGHGSGKLVKKEDGQCPIQFEDPLTNETFVSCYEPNESYQSKFAEISSSYEECRADLAGLHLTTFAPVYQVFGYAKADEKNLLWLNTMGLIRKAILGLSSAYNPESAKWG